MTQKHIPKSQALEKIENLFWSMHAWLLGKLMSLVSMHDY